MQSDQVRVAELSNFPDFLWHVSRVSDYDPAQIPPATLEEDASKRTAKRDSLFLLTTLSTESGETRGRARVRNLSETGLMADCDADFSSGERLVVHLRGIGEVSGAIAWVRGDRIGLAFDKQIDPLAARKPVKAAGAGTNAMSVHRRPICR